MIRSKSDNLDQSNGINFTEWVPSQFRSRLLQYNAIAKQLREMGYQTKIRMGAKDYLLSKRIKGSNIKWSDTSPVIIDENKMVKFNVGKIKEQETQIEDMEFPDDNINNKESDEPISKEFIKELQDIIAEEYEQENGINNSLPGSLPGEDSI